MALLLQSSCHIWKCGMISLSLRDAMLRIKIITTHLPHPCISWFIGFGFFFPWMKDTIWAFFLSPKGEEGYWGCDYPGEQCWCDYSCWLPLDSGPPDRKDVWSQHSGSHVGKICIGTVFWQCHWGDTFRPTIISSELPNELYSPGAPSRLCAGKLEWPLADVSWLVTASSAACTGLCQRYHGADRVGGFQQNLFVAEEKRSHWLTSGLLNVLGVRPCQHFCWHLKLGHRAGLPAALGPEVLCSS